MNINKDYAHNNVNTFCLQLYIQRMCSTYVAKDAFYS